MRQSTSGINKRHMEIVAELNKNKVVYINKLAKTLSVSPVTIRRDIDELAKLASITKIHGGAKITECLPTSIQLFEEKGQKNIKEKILIAQYVAKMIHDDDIVFMNSGSTVLFIPQFLQDKHVTIITNNIKMSSISLDENVNVILTGGTLNKDTQSLTGELANLTLRQVHASVCILGVNGISAEEGITTPFYQEVEINNNMLTRCGGKRIIVADSTKIGRSRHFISAVVNMIDTLITTTKANKNEVDKLLARGVNVIMVPFSEPDN